MKYKVQMFHSPDSGWVMYLKKGEKIIIQEEDSNRKWEFEQD